MKGEKAGREDGFWAHVPRGPLLPHPAELTPLPSPLRSVCHQQRSSGASGSHKIFPVLLPALRRLSCLLGAKKWWDYQVKHVCHQAQWVECCSRQVHRKMLICPRLGV